MEKLDKEKMKKLDKEKRKDEFEMTDEDNKVMKDNLKMYGRKQKMN